MAINIDGDGLIALGGTSTTQGRLRLAEDTDNGTNFVALQAPASIAADVTFTLPAADGTANQVLKTDGSGNLGFATPSAGKVLQVVSTAKTDTFTTTSASFVDITGLSVSITPASATSKILVFVDVNGSQDVGANRIALRLLRDSTTINAGAAAGSRTPAMGGFSSADSTIPSGTVSSTFLDSPATTSSLTYKMQVAVIITGGSTAFINRTEVDGDETAQLRMPSNITVMEIAA